MGCDVRSYNFTSDWSIGRFTQTDPLLFSRASEHYAYAFNNPLSVTDPMGLYGGGLAPGARDSYGLDQKGGVTPTLPPVTTRIEGGIQAGFGVLGMVVSAPLLVAPEPALTKIAGGATLWWSADNTWTGLQKAWTGNPTSTSSRFIAERLALNSGATTSRAQSVGDYTETALNAVAAGTGFLKPTGPVVTAKDLVRKVIQPKAYIAGGDTDLYAGVTIRSGGYDPATEALYLGKGGHFGGMAEAGGTAGVLRTPGVTVYETESVIYWANDSISLGLGMTPAQARNVQTALESAYQGKKVSQVTGFREAMELIKKKQ
jgi:hypothetical protein